MVGNSTSASAWGVSDRIATLHRRALVWDNTLPFDIPALRYDELLGRFRDSGVDCVSVTIAHDGSTMPTTMGKLAHDLAYFATRGDRFVVARSVEDIAAAHANGKLAVVFAFQGSVPFQRDPAFVEIYYRLGVRQALMAYNQKNDVGDGCHERTDGGLSRYGIRLVQEMNRVGMIVDCSHTGYRTTMDVFDTTERPAIFSHSNATAILDHRRNIAADQATACAQTGGVVGVCGDGAFLPNNDPGPEALFKQIDYYCELIGPDHVGLGLDFVLDPQALMATLRAAPDRWPDDQAHTTDISFAQPEQLAQLTEVMLDRGYRDEHVVAILGGNWLRVAREVWL
jgi:membrane dipeptidase